MRRHFALAILLISSTALQAQPAQLAPGEYVTPSGVLTIRTGKGADLAFRISVVGANAHTCELDGVIRKGQARMEDSADDKHPCIVTFAAEKDGVRVGSVHQGACRAYCGMRAGFEDTYLRPPAECTPRQVAETRKRFKAAYDAKQYAQARDLLAPVHARCEKFSRGFDFDWIRNDLALAQHRAGDSAACRQTLASLVELAGTADKEIRDGFPPSDADFMLRIARATRTNLKLCGHVAAAKKK